MKALLRTVDGAFREVDMVEFRDYHETITQLSDFTLDWPHLHPDETIKVCRRMYKHVGPIRAADGLILWEEYREVSR